MLILDQPKYPPVAFSGGLPGGIQLLQLPDPRNVREAMAAPDADGWKEAMEMVNLRLYGVYDSCTACPVCALCTWTTSSRTAFSRRTTPEWSPGAITNALVSITVCRSRPSFVSSRFALSSLWPPFAISMSFSSTLPQPIYTGRSGGALHGAAGGVYGTQEGILGLETQEGSLWISTGQ